MLDYGAVSHRRMMTDCYSAMTESVSESADVLLLFIDTPPLIDKYHDNPVRHPDAGMQDMDRQLAWIDAILGASQAGGKSSYGRRIFGETSIDGTA